MKKIWALLVFIFALACTSPSYAFDVRCADITAGQCRLAALQVRSEYASLPLCVREHIDETLRHVLVVSHDPKQPFVDATSFPSVGIMVVYINKPNFKVMIMPVAIMHEFGHWYDWAMEESRSVVFQNALMKDIVKLTPEQKKEMGYITTPLEAYAELFAATFLGEAYYRFDHYDIVLLPNAHKALLDYMCDQSQPNASDLYARQRREQDVRRK